MLHRLFCGFCLFMLLTAQNSLSADATSIKTAISSIQKIGKKGKGHDKAIQAMKQLSAATAEQIPEILGGMTTDNRLANNWLRGAVETIIDRTQESGKSIPKDQLLEFLSDQNNAFRGRELAFQLVTQDDEPLKFRLIDGMLNDSSLELRRMAVARALEKAKATEDEASQKEAFRKALSYARDKDQIDAAADELKKLGSEVDLAEHFGFIQNWQLIGPFDNRNKSGFDKEFPPEGTVDLADTISGKEDAKLTWSQHTTNDKYGLVDLNKAIGKHMGAAAYAYADFDSAKDQDIELRLGCINANKIWLNGKLLTANHVYHSGRGIDQYSGKGRLKKGANSILLKICQNEQTERWAQDWQFQLRVCDALGTAVLSTDRENHASN